MYLYTSLSSSRSPVRSGSAVFFLTVTVISVLLMSLSPSNAQSPEADSPDAETESREYAPIISEQNERILKHRLELLRRSARENNMLRKKLEKSQQKITELEGKLSKKLEERREKLESVDQALSASLRGLRETLE